MTDDPGGLHARCTPMGHLEYIVESRHHDQLETWLVMRPHASSAPRCEALGMSLSPGCRLVVEAHSLRPVGVLPSTMPAAPMAAGFNPYFDLSAT
jgi:hypothetical protein